MIHEEYVFLVKRIFIIDSFIYLFINIYLKKEEECLDTEMATAILTTKREVKETDENSANAKETDISPKANEENSANAEIDCKQNKSDDISLNGTTESSVNEQTDENVLLHKEEIASILADDDLEEMESIRKNRPIVKRYYGRIEKKKSSDSNGNSDLDSSSDSSLDSEEEGDEEGDEKSDDTKEAQESEYNFIPFTDVNSDDEN